MDAECRRLPSEWIPGQCRPPANLNQTWLHSQVQAAAPDHRGCHLNLQQVVWLWLPIFEAGHGVRAQHVLRRHGVGGVHRVLRKQCRPDLGHQYLSHEWAREHAAPDHARNFAHVVWRPRNDEVVERYLVKRKFRDSNKLRRLRKPPNEQRIRLCLVFSERERILRLQLWVLDALQQRNQQGDARWWPTHDPPDRSPLPKYSSGALANWRYHVWQGSSFRQTANALDGIRELHLRMQKIL